MTAAATTLPAATAPRTLQSAIGDLKSQLPSDPRLRQRNIALAIVGIVCLVWLLAAVPNVLLWALARPAASTRMVGSGALMFWVGVLAACGGIMEWSFFMNSAKMRASREWFGDQGARWFYVGVGGVIAVLGLGVTISATAYSFFGTTRRSPERAVFAQRPVAGQPLVGPQVAAQPAVPTPPPPPPGALRPRKAPFAHAAPPAGDQAPRDPPAAPLAPANQPPRVGDELPGQWRALHGGLCIKIPAEIQITEDRLTHSEVSRLRNPDPAARAVDQQIRGYTQIGPTGVSFAVSARSDPSERPFVPQAMLDSVRQGRGLGDMAGGEILLVNGLTVVKVETHRTQPAALTGRPITLHGTAYHYFDERNHITVRVYSELPLDDPTQQALRVYMDTLQRMPPAADTADAAQPPAATESSDSASPPWKPLAGGFRIRLVPAIEIREDQITRHGDTHQAHRLIGQTDDGVQVEIHVLEESTWNHTNEARQIAAHRSRRPHQGYEHRAVNINGLVMEKITTNHLGSPHKMGHFEYKYREGQHEINMKVWSDLSPTHPSVEAVIRSVESIERVAPEG
jgi:hypothetical protein